MLNFFQIMETLAPFYLLIILGFIIKKLNLITNETTLTMNKVVFNVFLPILIFTNLCKADIEDTFNWSVISFAGIFTLAIFLFSITFVPLIEKENSKRSVLMQCIFRGNIVLLGLPMATELCGAAGSAMVTLIISLVTPLYNVLSVLCFEIYNGSKFNIRRTLINMLKNPLIIASVLGLGAMFLDIQLPYILDKFLSDIGKTATPLALILLGGYFEFRQSEFRLITIGLLGRLLIAPSLCLAGAILLGFRGVEIISLLLLGCTPTAVSSFTMASELKGDVVLASDLFIYSTAVSVITIPGWIYLVQRLGIF